MKWWKRKSDPKVSITLLAYLRRPRLQCSCYSQKKMSKWFCYSFTSKSIRHLWKFQLLLVWMLRYATFKGKYKSQLLYPYKRYSLFWSSVISLHSSPKLEQYIANISADVIHNKSQTFYRAEVRGLCSSSLVRSSSKFIGRFSFPVIDHFWAVPPCRS